jgi:hypothetical protein
MWDPGRHPVALPSGWRQVAVFWGEFEQIDREELAW